MKLTTLVFLFALSCNVAMAQYKPVDKRSSVLFTIKNFGFDVKGTFGGVQGAINFDAQNTAGSTIDVTIDAATINTDNSLRDSHLKGQEYFDVKNYPAIHFVSSKITGKSNNYTVTGKLTIKGKTRDIFFPFSATADNDGYLFKGSFKINRKDFDIGGTSTIANELEVTLNIFANKSQST